MPEITLQRRTVIPAAVGTAETIELFTVRKGWRVWISLWRRVAPAALTTSTWNVGDSLDPGRYLENLDTEGPVDEIVDGWNPDTVLFAQPMQSGYLYTQNDTISLIYTPGATPGATIPTCIVTMEMWQVWS